MFKIYKWGLGRGVFVPTSYFHRKPMMSRNKSFRSLSSVEKKLFSQNLNNKRNGLMFAAVYSTCFDKEETWSDNATLLTVKDQRLSTSLVSRALKKVINNNVELYTTINDNLEFQPVKTIMFDDVVQKVEFDSYKDELVNCHDGVPPYLLRHIFDKNKFETAKHKPLWQILIVDETMVIFHGHDVLFDIFAAANFHKLFQQALNQLPKDGPTLECLFKNDSKASFFPKSIYENHKLRLPAIATDLFQLQTQSFFKSVYNWTIKKPLDFINTNPNSGLKYYQSCYTDILLGANNLCGTTVFGNISAERVCALKKIMKQENICLSSFVCAIALLCLKPLVNNFGSSVTFSIPVNLRSTIPQASRFGLCYKNVLVECPLTLIDDKVFQGLNVYNGYDIRNTKPTNKDPNYEESLLEYQFREACTHVDNTLKQRWRAWERSGFNDDDIKRMKFGKTEQGKSKRIIEVNDVTEFQFHVDDNATFNIKDVCFTKSQNLETFMSLSCAFSERSGLNVCIHYPDGYNMDVFVECFQSFMEELSQI